MIVKFKKLHEDAKIPYKKHKEDAGFDLTAVSKAFDSDNNVWSYDTGIAVEIPNGYAGLLFPRSSIYKTDSILSNSVGVIDSGYTNSIQAKFRYDQMSSKEPYQVGDRICQLVIIPIPDIEFEEVNELSDTDRGKGGFGSTGIN